MQWNIMGFPGSGKWWDSAKNGRFRAMDFLTRYNPDVICIQDFSETKSRHQFSNISFFTDTLHYPFMHVVEYAHSISKYTVLHHSTIIFSKLPFRQTGSIPYHSGPYPEHIVWADIQFRGKDIRVVSTHFRSIHLFSHKTFNRDALPYHMKPDSGIIMSADLLKKLTFFQGLHAGQAQRLRSFIDSSNKPVILGADLNCVPAGYVYRTVKGDLSDGFGANEFGVGATYNYLLPNLRIDYLFNDNRLKRVQWKHFDDGFFDHDHLMTDLEWKQD
jgi:endonuclease/exonuclease/phosphatase family metal-dependent hydrolase